MPLVPSSLNRRTQLGAAALALLGIGAGAGAAIAHHGGHARVMAPIVPVAIRALPAEGMVSIRGRVEQVYGASFVVADATGRTLVQIDGRERGQPLVETKQPVIVQGMADHGTVRPSFLIGPDRRVIALLGDDRGERGRRGRDARHDPAA